MKRAIRIISVVLVAVLCVTYCISCSSTENLQMEAYEKDLRNLIAVFPAELTEATINFGVIKNKDERYPDGVVAQLSFEFYYCFDHVEEIQGFIVYFEDEENANSYVLNYSKNETWIRNGCIVYSHEEVKDFMDTLSKKRNKLSKENKRVFDTLLSFYKESSRNIRQTVTFSAQSFQSYQEYGLFCQLLIPPEIDDEEADFVLFFTDENKAMEYWLENKTLSKWWSNGRNGDCKGDVIYSLSDDLKTILLGE